MPKKKVEMVYVHFVVGLAIMLLIRFMPVELPGVTPVGKQILGIFIGTLYLWTTADPVWSSLFCIFMIGASDYGPMGSVLSATFGNPTVVQIFFLMIIMNTLQVHRLSAYIGRFFLTRKVIVGRPWAFTAVLFIGSVLIAAFVGCFAPIFLFWPILYDIFQDTGMKPKEAYPTIMIILIAVGAAIGFPVPPYMSNGLALISNYATITANILGTSVVINNAQWLLVALVYGFVCAGAIILFAKFVLRPDVSKLQDLTLEQLNKNPLPPLSKEQKMVAVIIVCFLLSMMLPSIFPFLPGMAWLSANSYGVAILFMVILCVLRSDGKPVFSVKDNMVPFAWGTYFLVTSAILLGSVLTNDSTGVITFLNTVLSPIFQNMSPMVFSIVVLVIGCVLTNICNSLVIGMILQPVIATYCLSVGVNSAPIAAIMSMFVLACAIATPAASPFAAMLFGNKEWLRAKDIYKYDLMFVAIELVLVLVVGLPLANMFIH